MQKCLAIDSGIEKIIEGIKERSLYLCSSRVDNVQVATQANNLQMKFQREIDNVIIRQIHQNRKLKPSVLRLTSERNWSLKEKTLIFDSTLGTFISSRKYWEVKTGILSSDKSLFSKRKYNHFKQQASIQRAQLSFLQRIHNCNT